MLIIARIAAMASHATSTEIEMTVEAAPPLSMTTTDLWESLEKVLREKGATDAWIAYALPDLHVASQQFAFAQYGLGHRDARHGIEMPNPGPNDKPMVIIIEDDGSRWLSLDEPLRYNADGLARLHAALGNVDPDIDALGKLIDGGLYNIKAPLPAGMADSPEIREQLAKAIGQPRCPYCEDKFPDECRYC